METAVNLFMGFANEKMRARMKVHGAGKGFEPLIESLGKDVLPVEYGGTNGKMQDHIGTLLGYVHCDTILDNVFFFANCRLHFGNFQRKEPVA